MRIFSYSFRKAASASSSKIGLVWKNSAPFSLFCLVRATSPGLPSGRVMTSKLLEFVPFEVIHWVGIGVVASSLFVLGFMRELEGLADPMADRQAVNREFDNLLPVRRQPEEGDGTEAGPVVSDFNF